jgi:SAM-dependent methyltransferase
VTVLDVGAGAGSYEPVDRWVIAVEPSELMLGIRRRRAAPATRATAEALPVRSQAFDAALVVLSLHHWTDWQAGLAELTRVSRRQVLLIFDPKIHNEFWLIRDYFPAIARLPSNHPPSPQEIAEALGGAQILDVPVPSDCQDGFLWAYFNRPEAFLDPSVQACNSSMALLSVEQLQEGTTRLEEDLKTGAWQRRHADLLSQSEMDGGFRLVVSPPAAPRPT